MKYLNENDKGKAICNDCNKLVTTIYKYRSVPFSNGVGVVNNILVGICTICFHTISIPHQSSAQIKKEYNSL